MSNRGLAYEGLVNFFLTYYCAWTFPGLFPCPSCALCAGVLGLCVYLCVYENLQAERQKKLRNEVGRNLHASLMNLCMFPHPIPVLREMQNLKQKS